MYFLIFVLFTTSFAYEEDDKWTTISDLTFTKNQPLKLDKYKENLMIKNITGTIFFDSLSLLKVKKLIIVDSELDNVEEGALCHISELEELELFANRKFPKLTKQILKNCQYLKTFKMVFNSKDGQPSTMEIEANAFSHLVNLQELFVLYQQMPHLTHQHFKHLFNLKILSIMDSQVGKIDEDAFESLRNCEEIYLRDNKINNIEGVFVNMTKLKKLDLSDNHLRNLTWNEFEGLHFLESLNLGDNKISFFDVDKICSYLPNLQKLVISDNPVHHTEILDIVRNLRTKLHHVQIKFFNPLDNNL